MSTKVEIELIGAPEWYYTGGPDEDPEFEPDITDVDVECSFCKTGIGWVETSREDDYGNDIEGQKWEEYYEVRTEEEDGFKDSVRLCEPCFALVATIGPAAAEYDAAWQAAHTWAADRARDLQEHPELVDQPGVPDSRERLQARVRLYEDSRGGTWEVREL
jgi:hypothetical protein